jgi:hypothetical protein
MAPIDQETIHLEIMFMAAPCRTTRTILTKPAAWSIGEEFAVQTTSFGPAFALSLCSATTLQLKPENPCGQWRSGTTPVVLR